MSDSNNFQIINPPNRLKVKVPRHGGPDLKEIQAATREGMAALKEDFVAWTRADLDAILSSLGRAKERPELADEAYGEILRRAADIKGQAATFDIPMLSRAAASLTRYLDGCDSGSEKKASIVGAHHQAMRFIFSSYLAGTESSGRLMDALEELVRKTASV